MSGRCDFADMDFWCAEYEGHRGPHRSAPLGKGTKCIGWPESPCPVNEKAGTSTGLYWGPVCEAKRIKGITAQMEKIQREWPTDPNSVKEGER